MTTTLSVKGQIVIPQKVRNQYKLKAGADFTVVTRNNGDILLRPVKARRKHRTLADNLIALSGIELDMERAVARNLAL